MSIFVSPNCASGAPRITAAGPEVVATRGAFTLAADKPAQNDTIRMVVLPAGHVPVDLWVDSDDLDANAGAPAITISVGILDAAKTGLAANTTMINASTVGQAGGIARADKKELARIAVDTVNDREIGILFPAAPGTASGGVIGLTLLYRAV